MRLIKTVKANILYPLTPLFDTILFSFSGQQLFTCGNFYILLQEMSDFFTLFGAFAVFRKVLLASSCLSVCASFSPSVRMEQLGSHWTYFHEI
jgi:hypothetical protein